jgi:cellobiose-specific phosphotransferase system component IIB
MAIFPQGLTNIDQRCNPGERRVLHQLKRCLEDDYLVWHNVPLGPRARQPDFVILSPRQGILLLEVKDWRRSTLVSASRDRVEIDTTRGRVTEANPLRQARDYAMELVEVMQRDPALLQSDGPYRGKLLFPYGWGVVFSRMTRNEVVGTNFEDVFPAQKTLLRDELAEDIEPADFQSKLWGMFTVSYRNILTLPQRDRIRWHLFPEIRVPQQATLDISDTGGGTSLLPDLLKVMDLQQEQIARTLGEGHRVIHGAAGSGKTMILVFRAQHLAQMARPDQPVLVLCFNRTLADRIDSQLRQRGVDERVQVRTFHAWCWDVVKSYQLQVPQVDDMNERYRLMVEVVARAIRSGLVPGGQYLALLVDEAHDFEDAWLRMAVSLVSPATNSLLVLYDDAQSIYQAKRRKFNFASVGIEARGRTSILKLNYRNTAEVLALAVRCAQSLLQGADEVRGEDEIPLVQPSSAGRRGSLPVLVQARDEREEAELIAERVAQAYSSGLPLESIAVICRVKFLMKSIEQALTRHGIPVQSMNSQAFRRFDWGRPSVKLLTMHSAKGLEFPLVFVAGLQALPTRDESMEDAARLLYVSMTRATQDLVLSAHGTSPIVSRVRDSLGEVARQFAAPSTQGGLKRWLGRVGLRNESK